MNIVVLDGYTLNPGDLSWSEWEKLGRLVVYDRTSPEEIVDRAYEAEILITNKTPLSADTLARLPKLKYIGVLATGYNVIDTEAARQRGIPVTNVPTYGTQSVAQFVFALLLELSSQVGRHDEAVKQGEWSRSQDFCFTRSTLVELSGKTMGLVGLGRIGGQTARIARALDMRVLAAGSGRTTPPPHEDVEWVPLERLLAESDVVSLHCPLTPATERMINAERIELMKRSAFLINTSRGALIDEQALAQALHAGRIAGAALDVLAVEPPPAEHPLLTAPNCIITPHIAWATQEARARLMATAVDNVRSFMNGVTVNAVNNLGG
ncbi:MULTISPECIES: D-2-hydroxyacid dehydrogenase [Paenibacillus]|uniref:D-2-hydroxyacid dehydrogenase n=3 Tax=Paenibacillus validus TaxID=44253 RepID=A0A7X3CRX6_9BACL|nr:MULTISPECIES: D-2-hydroxyacid dehydrogenase [Paenibacillus]MUG69417.1 D-2-hydroxyacid dehydrogenase [Paenibacillus validus]